MSFPIPPLRPHICSPPPAGGSLSTSVNPRRGVCRGPTLPHTCMEPDHAAVRDSRCQCALAKHECTLRCACVQGPTASLHTPLQPYATNAQVSGSGYPMVATWGTPPEWRRGVRSIRPQVLQGIHLMIPGDTQGYMSRMFGVPMMIL